MNTSLSQSVSLVKLNIARRKLIAKIPYSNLNLNILKILYHEGFVRGLKVTDSSTKIFVYFKRINLNQVF